MTTRRRQLTEAEVAAALEEILLPELHKIIRQLAADEWARRRTVYALQAVAAWCIATAGLADHNRPSNHAAFVAVVVTLAAPTRAALDELAGHLRAWAREARLDAFHDVPDPAHLANLADEADALAERVCEADGADQILARRPAAAAAT